MPTSVSPAVTPVIGVVWTSVGAAVSNESRFVPLSAKAAAGVTRSSRQSRFRRAVRRSGRFFADEDGNHRDGMSISRMRDRAVGGPCRKVTVSRQSGEDKASFGENAGAGGEIIWEG